MKHREQNGDERFFANRSQGAFPWPRVQSGYIRMNRKITKRTHSVVIPLKTSQPSQKRGFALFLPNEAIALGAPVQRSKWPKNAKRTQPETRNRNSKLSGFLPNEPIATIPKAINAAVAEPGPSPGTLILCPAHMRTMLTAFRFVTLN